MARMLPATLTPRVHDDIIFIVVVDIGKMKMMSSCALVTLKTMIHQFPALKELGC